MITGNEAISLALILSILAAAGTITNIVSTVKKDRKEEEQKHLDIEKNFVKINVKLDQFCDTTKDMLKSQEKASDRATEMTKQMIQSSEQIKQLFNTVNDHEERITELEKTK